MSVTPTGPLADMSTAEISLEATIIRADGRIEHLGRIAYYHRNPLKRLAWRIGRWLRRDFA
jgi:hypothetical protein